MQLRSGFTKKDYDRNGFLKKAVTIDSCAIDYVCPNNRNGDKGGHFYAMHVSEKLPQKKIPKCPYCKSLCEMIDWDKKTKEQDKND